MIPRKVRILGKVYSVVDADLKNSYGLCADVTQTISVLPDMAHDLERDTLLHECIHAIDYHLQLGLTEHQVGNLGMAIYALLKDNPKMANYLVES